LRSEVLALRTIVINTIYDLADGEGMKPERMQELIAKERDRAVRALAVTGNRLRRLYPRELRSYPNRVRTAAELPTFPLRPGYIRTPAECARVLTDLDLVNVKWWADHFFRLKP
jgi:hypothetical protein